MYDIKPIIEKIYKDHNPEKIDNIPVLLEKYKGRESEILLKIAAKYHLNLENYLQVDYALLVKAIFEKYNPENVSSVDSLMEDYQYREKELLKVLCRKYNCDSNEIIISNFTAISSKPKPIITSEGAPAFFDGLNIPWIIVLQKLKSKNFIIGSGGIIFLSLLFIFLFSSGIFRHFKNSTVQYKVLLQNTASVDVPQTETNQDTSSATVIVNEPSNSNVTGNPPTTTTAGSKQTEDVNAFGRGNGKITVFQTCVTRTEIQISIDGNFIGNLSEIFSTVSPPSCGSSGTVSKILTAGRHHLSGQDSQGTTWDMMVSIQEGKCLLQEIKEKS